MATDPLRKALGDLEEAASRDIEVTCSQLRPILTENPECSLANWSIRVSSDGLEVVDARLEDWLRGEDFTSPSYVLCFDDDDTLARLLSVITEHREGLVTLLTSFVLRGLGLQARQTDNPFVSAIETPPSQYRSASQDLPESGTNTLMMDFDV